MVKNVQTEQRELYNDFKVYLKLIDYQIFT